MLIIYPSDSLPVKDGYVAFVLAGFDVGGMIAELIEEPEQATNPIVANGQDRLLNWQEFDKIVEPLDDVAHQGGSAPAARTRSVSRSRTSRPPRIS